MTERLHFQFSLSCTGEENGNPLQWSCLENPRDRGALRAAVYGVAQSQTWLKQLSSSSNFQQWVIWQFIFVSPCVWGLQADHCCPVEAVNRELPQVLKQYAWITCLPNRVFPWPCDTTTLHGPNEITQVVYQGCTWRIDILGGGEDGYICEKHLRKKCSFLAF